MNMQADPVLSFYGDFLGKENDFLVSVDEFIQDIAAMLQQEGRGDDSKLKILRYSYDMAIKNAGQLYQVLQITINGINNLLPELEDKIPPMGHESRQSALYLLGCHSCIKLSPRSCFFVTMDEERSRYLDHLMSLLQKGSLDSDALWSETQPLLQLEATIPLERKDPEAEKAKHRKKTMVIPFAFAAGKWLGDQGIDFLKDIAAEAGFL